MTPTDPNPTPPDANAENHDPLVKVYTPRLDEFEEAVAYATRRYHELPDWLKASMKGRLRSK